MRRRLRSAGIIGAMFALILPELAISTAAMVLTPAVAEAQVGGVHRRTRRRTRRRTAVVVHSADQQQAAAQQQQQQAPPPDAQQQAPPPPPPDGQQMSGADQPDTSTGNVPSLTTGAEVLATLTARGPPDAARRSAAGGQRQRDG
ncbi:MAG: hypothetical protein M8861_09450 [marine benthic group bacterium]|nr:hypothetical protein [Gemmatimonadota bacterium]